MSVISGLLFPGQGSQYVGMGRDLYERYPQAQAVFDQAADQLEDLPLLALMFGDERDSKEAAEALRQTEVTQPALFVHSMAAMSVLSEMGFVPDMAAGHSLGEYSALAATEAITFADGLDIVRIRGLAMASAGNAWPGTMAAILGLEDSKVEDLCNEASSSTPGVVQAANFNAPGQIVISGDRSSVEQAIVLAKEAGAKRAVALDVSGAFHSPLMDPAREQLAGALRDIVIREPVCPVYLNVTARPTRDPDAIRAALLLQLTSPVRWMQTVRNMKADGAERFIEVGPGSVLTGLAKRSIAAEIQTAQCGTEADLVTLTSELADADFESFD